MGRPSGTLAFIASRNLGTPIYVYVSITERDRPRSTEIV